MLLSALEGFTLGQLAVLTDSTPSRCAKGRGASMAKQWRGSFLAVSFLWISRVLRPSFLYQLQQYKSGVSPLKCKGGVSEIRFRQSGPSVCNAYLSYDQNKGN